LLVLTGAGSMLAQGPEIRFGGEIPPEVDTIYERGLGWLAQAQKEAGDGKMGTRVQGWTGFASWRSWRAEKIRTMGGMRGTFGGRCAIW